VRPEELTLAFSAQVYEKASLQFYIVQRDLCEGDPLNNVFVCVQRQTNMSFSKVMRHRAAQRDESQRAECLWAVFIHVACVEEVKLLHGPLTSPFQS
jgi:hypothetical protein